MKTKRVKSIDDLPSKPNAALKRAAAKYKLAKGRKPARDDFAGLVDDLQRSVRIYSDAVEKVTQLVQQNVRTLHDVVVVEVIARLAVESKETSVAEDVRYAFEYADAVIAEKTKRSKVNGATFTTKLTNAAAADPGMLWGGGNL